MVRPSIDHSLLSPSGRMSKRAREAATRREAKRLFPRELTTSREPAETEVSRLLARAQTLRELADRGMKPKVYRRIAAEREAQAKRIADTEGR